MKKTGKINRDALVQALRVPLWAAMIAAMIAVAFALWPELDLVISQWFFDPVLGTFPLNESVFLQWVSRISNGVIVLFLATITLLVVYGYWQKKSVFGLTQARFVYLVMVLAIGPVQKGKQGTPHLSAL